MFVAVDPREAGGWVLVLYLVNTLPIDGRARQIVRVIVIVIAVVSLLKYIAVF
ncbi:MAG TPA: Thivi_2564 family membrane protein [Pseudorhodoplanes sp.]|nr:Thivi_2564 family membrane protein [Pseudorhodoplanes sp.]